MVANEPKIVTDYSDKELYKAYPTKWATEKEFKTYNAIYNRFSSMQTWRQTSCPWSSPEGDSTPSATTSGSDWAARWKQDYKLWSMWRRIVNNQSNIKSEMTFTAVETAVSEFMENDQTVTFHPTEEDDREKIMVISHMFRHWENVSDAALAKQTSFRENTITGTSFMYQTFIRKVRNIETILSGADSEKEVENIRKGGDDKSKENLEKRLKSKKPLTKKEQIVEYDDVATIPVSIFEVYVDPSARCLRGSSHEATDLVWRTSMSVQQARAFFRGNSDPFVKKDNVGKIKSGKEAQGAYGDKKNPVYIYPDDLEEDQVEFIRYFNKQTDKYIILVNDVVLRDGPLPFNHKQIPFSVHKFIDIPHQFYGMGMGYLLEPVQAADESLFNMSIDQTIMTVNRPCFINSALFPDIDEQMDSLSPGQLISLSGDVGPGNIRYMDPAPLGIDVYRVREDLSNRAISISGVNPLLTAAPTPNQPVRNNLISIESSLKLLKKGIKSWADGYKEASKQIISIMRQFYTEDYLEQVDGNEEKPKRRKSIRIEGKTIIDTESGLEQENTSGYSFFPIKSEYLDLAGDVDIEVNTDTLVPMSNSLQLQNLQAAFTNLAPILANPQVLESPGLNEMVREFVELSGLSPRITEQLEERSNKEKTERAFKQEELMLNGENLPGIPGESDSHKMVHMLTLMKLNASLNERNITLQPTLQQASAIDNFRLRLWSHLQTDMQSKYASSEYAMSQTEQQGAQQQAPQTAPPEGGAGEDILGQILASAGGPGGAGAQPMNNLGGV